MVAEKTGSKGQHLAGKSLGDIRFEIGELFEKPIEIESNIEEFAKDWKHVGCGC